MIANTPPRTLTPDVSRLARQELGGMSQAAVSKASGVQAYIIKQWEAGRFRPPAAALEKLRDFYVAESVDLDAIAEHLTASQPVATDAGTGQSKLATGFTHNARPGFFVSPDLSDELIGDLMQRMEANDDRIVELTARSFDSGFFGGPSEATEAAVRELLGTLAESYLLFRFLQGRNIVAKTPGDARQEPKTIGDFLSQWVRSESDAGALFDAAPADLAATAREVKRASRTDTAE